MGSNSKTVTLIATADWNEANNRDGFRFLNLEIDPFLQRNKSGGWRLGKKDRLKLRVQIINRRPVEAIELIENMHPDRLSITFCPALRYRHHPGTPEVTPFGKRIDRQIRRGLTGFREEASPQVPFQPSRLFEVLRHGSRKPFRARFKKEGGFDFMVGLAVDLYDGHCNFLERRRFRSDPEMDVGEVEDPIDGPYGKAGTR